MWRIFGERCYEWFDHGLLLLGRELSPHLREEGDPEIKRKLCCTLIVDNLGKGV